MKIRSLLLGLVLVGAMATVSAQNDLLIDGVRYTIHQVTKGETLYSLSRHYGVTIEDITNANKELSEGLKVGQRLKIPAVSGTTKSRNRHNTTSGATHKVAKGETLYSLSKLYGVSIEELCKANPGVENGLKTGLLLVIPLTHSESVQPNDVVHSEPISEPAPEPASEPTPAHATETTQTNSEQVGLKTAFDQLLHDLQYRNNQPFRTLAPGSRAEVALLLPFGSEVKPSQNYLDFYRGFLIGLDSVRMSGHSVNLRLFNTAHSYERVASIIQSGELHQVDLVVGPIYEDELLPVASALQERGTPIVSPLANLTQTSAKSVFQMSSSPTAKYDKVRDLFNGSKRVVIISAESVDKEFDAEVRAMLQGGVKVVEHKYIYEHQSVIEKRAEERAANGTHSPSDMTPLLRGKEPSVIVITAKNEVDVDRILAALASAKASLSDRSQRSVPYIVFGNNRWNRYRAIDKTLFFKNNVMMLSTYYAGRADEKIRTFDKRFVEEYGSLPSPYAYRGYDAAVVFVSALYGGLETGLEGVLSMPLLTPYVFEVDATSGIRKNNQWVRINYNSNYTITTE